ncbi:Heavy metal-associated isoprenylated plant protein 41 [Linum grandiflorum]
MMMIYGDVDHRSATQYSPEHDILLVGDGDLSFSLSLARTFGSADNIVATSLEDKQELMKKYKDAESNIEELKAYGGQVIHGVDATKMRFRNELRLRKFDRIIFNFPHVGFHAREDSPTMIRENSKLVQGFFKNASGMLRPHGEIHVTHKTGKPFCCWNIVDLALGCYLVLKERAEFRMEDYPFYRNKRGDGRDSDKEFRIGRCNTFKFTTLIHHHGAGFPLSAPRCQHFQDDHASHRRRRRGGYSAALVNNNVGRRDQLRTALYGREFNAGIGCQGVNNVGRHDQLLAALYGAEFNAGIGCEGVAVAHSPGYATGRRSLDGGVVEVEQEIGSLHFKRPVIAVERKTKSRRNRATTKDPSSAMAVVYGDEVRRWITHYSSDQQILLVGEGDFSFSLCLATAFGSASNIVATSLDTKDELKKKYKNAESNIEELERLGAQVLHRVDATQMRHRGSELSIRKFDRIVYNFPHAGFHGKEDNILVIQRHARLVQGFFRNAAGMLRPYGEVHVSHKTSTPYCCWDIENLALGSSLVATKHVDFNKDDYPGYNNKRGDGNDPDGPFPLGECSTFKFIFALNHHHDAGGIPSGRCQNCQSISAARTSSIVAGHTFNGVHDFGVQFPSVHWPNFGGGIVGRPLDQRPISSEYELKTMSRCRMLVFLYGREQQI